MNIDFGKIKKYISDRGFGFVKHSFKNNGKGEVFFHISDIKKSNSKIYEALIENKDEDDIYFWYEFVETKKGKQLKRVLDRTSISDEQLFFIKSNIERRWLDISKDISQWLDSSAHDLLLPEEITLLNDKRTVLIRSEQDRLEKERVERLRLIKLREEEKRKAQEQQKVIEDNLRKQQEIEEAEFKALVNEILPLNFSRSAQVSNYIVENKLGYKYQNISGVLEMTSNGTSWNFKGGFPPKIYARLCQELGLGNQGSSAKPTNFTPFKNIEHLDSKY